MELLKTGRHNPFPMQTRSNKMIGIHIKDVFIGTPEQLSMSYPLLPEMDSTDDTEYLYDIIATAFDEVFEIKTFMTKKERREWFTKISEMSKATNIVWTKLSHKVPEAGQTYLILTDMGIGLTADVALYHGQKENGDHLWSLSDISLEPKLIKYWALFNLPDQK